MLIREDRLGLGYRDPPILKILMFHINYHGNRTYLIPMLFLLFICDLIYKNIIKGPYKYNLKGVQCVHTSRFTKTQIYIGTTILVY